MPAITTSSAESNCCAKCLVRLESVSLKCTRCSILCHLRCSDLPEYMLLRFKTSQAAYICRACVLGEGDPESLKEEQELIKQIIINEEKTIEAAAKDSNCSIDDAMKKVENCEETCDISETVLSVTNNVSSNVISDESARNLTKNQNKRKVCRYFLRRTCMHGAKGEACKFEHPKLCYKFIRNGSKNGGCKKEDCAFYHPKLCQNSLRERKCGNQNCRFFHLNGTNRAKPLIEESNNYEIRKSVMHERKESNVPQSTANLGSLYSQAVQRRELYGRSDQQMEAIEPLEYSNQSQSDFLYLKRQIQQLTIQMAQLTSSLSSLKKEDTCCPRKGLH